MHVSLRQHKLLCSCVLQKYVLEVALHLSPVIASPSEQKNGCREVRILLYSEFQAFLLTIAVFHIEFRLMSGMQGHQALHELACMPWGQLWKLQNCKCAVCQCSVCVYFFFQFSYNWALMQLRARRISARSHLCQDRGKFHPKDDRTAQEDCLIEESKVQEWSQAILRHLYHMMANALCKL